MAVAVAESVWVSLAGACRVTLRPDITLKAWRAAGLFSDDEWRIDTTKKQGIAHPVFIRLDALERVHRAHGGVRWYPEQADEVNPPPRFAKRLTELEEELAAKDEEIARLAAELARMKRQAVPTTPLSLAELLPESPARHVSRTPTTPKMPQYQSRLPTSDDLPDFLPVRDGDPAQAVNAFAERHGFKDHTNTWRKPMRNGDFPWIIDGESEAGKALGGPWKGNGYLVVKYIFFSEGRREFCHRFAKLPYVHACGDPTCECYGILRPA